MTPQERAKAQDRIARALTVASVSSGDSSEGSLVLLLGGSVVLVLGVALGYAPAPPAWQSRSYSNSLIAAAARAAPCGSTGR